MALEFFHASAYITYISTLYSKYYKITTGKKTEKDRQTALGKETKLE